jgi:hypothetical protein
MYFLLLLAVREGMIKERVLQEGGTPEENERETNPTSGYINCPRNKERRRE